MIEAIPSSIEKVQTKEGYIRITVDTQENLAKDAVAELFDLKQSKQEDPIYRQPPLAAGQGR